MPYVQRNWKGEITGLFANAQIGYAEEELADDNEEVIAFRLAHPVPPEMLRPMTKDQQNQLRDDHKRLDAEHEALRNAIWAFNNAFNELEIALSALLHEALHVPNSQVSYAIYFSPTGFDARAKLVDNAILQLTIENSDLADLAQSWSKLFSEFSSTRVMRNSISHGMPITLGVRGKGHVRLTSPAFDIVRVGRIIQQGRIPGITAADIVTGVKKITWLVERIDEVNRLLAVFHDKGNPTLPEKYRALTDGLLKTA